MKCKDLFSLGKNVRISGRNSAIDFDYLVKIIKYGLYTSPEITAIDRKVKDLTRIGLNDLCLTGADFDDYKKSKINPVKENQWFFLFGGHCPTHHSIDNLEANGFAQGDIDFKVKGGNVLAQKFKSLLSTDPYIKLCAVSLSGFGVKFMIETGVHDPDLYCESITQFYKYLTEQYAVEVCEILGTDCPDDLLEFCDTLNIAIPCFVFIDPEVYTNKNNQVFTPHFEEKDQPDLKQYQPISIAASTIKEAIEQVEYQEAEWEDWYKVGYALANVCGDEAGEQLFYMLSQKSSKYQEKKARATWKSILKRNRNREKQAGLTTIKVFLLEWGVELKNIFVQDEQFFVIEAFTNNLTSGVAINLINEAGYPAIWDN